MTLRSSPRTVRACAWFFLSHFLLFHAVFSFALVVCSRLRFESGCGCAAWGDKDLDKEDETLWEDNWEGGAQDDGTSICADGAVCARCSWVCMVVCTVKSERLVS